MSRDKTRLNTVCQGSNTRQQNRIVLQVGIWASRRTVVSRANYPVTFYYDFNWRTTSFGWKLVGFNTRCREQCTMKPERDAPTNVIDYFAIVTLSWLYKPWARTFSRIIAYAVKICYQRLLQNLATASRFTEAWRTSPSS